MQHPLSTAFFLGANTPSGFHSLYAPLTTSQDESTLFLLKGGAPCGRSAFLQRVGHTAEELGYPVTYIHCSSDPEALDALLIEGLTLTLISGTPPHLGEPPLSGKLAHYINLEESPSPPITNEQATHSTNHANQYVTCYNRACRCLTGATQLALDGRTTLLTPELEEKMAKRVRGILSRELPHSQTGQGQLTQRFLSCVTSQGQVCHFDTVNTLCQRVYVISDNYGLAHPMLTQLSQGFLSGGHQVIACPSPLFPDRLEHLLIPSLSLAFVTSTTVLPYPQTSYRHIRLDAMVNQDLWQRHKGRLRFSKKLSNTLIEEATTALAEAKGHYDQLDALYHPSVNFEAIYQRAHHFTQTWFPSAES